MIGISHIEIALPSYRMTIKEMAEKAGYDHSTVFDETGIKTKVVLGKDENIMELVLKSVGNLLSESCISVHEIDFIILCSGGTLQSPLWSPAARIQKEINARNAFSFEVLNGCNAGNLGLHIASNMLMKDSSKTTAIVVVADKLSSLVDYYDREQICIFNFSDAACALLLKKGESSNQILSFTASTDASFADHMNVDRKTGLISINSTKKEDDLLAEAYRMGYLTSIQRVLSNVGLNTSDISYIFMNQGDHRLIPKLASLLAINENIIFQSFKTYGHMGGVDIFFGLKSCWEQSRIKSGDYCVLASSAVGFSWGAALIKI